MPSYCGLDFGTSNSTVATIGKDGPLLVPIEDSYTAIPTVVFFRYDDNKILYGQAAISEYISGAEGRQMRSLKTILGTELMQKAQELDQLQDVRHASRSAPKRSKRRSVGAATRMKR